MKYTLLLVSIVALFIASAQAAPDPNNKLPDSSKQDAEIENLMKKLKEDLAMAQNDDGGSIESLADEQEAPGLNKELEKIMKAEAQDENDGMEQAMFQADEGPGAELEQFSLAQGDDPAKAQYYYYYRYYIYYYRLYCRWRHYYYNLLRYYKSYRHLYITYRRLYYRCVHHRHG